MTDERWAPNSDGPESPAPRPEVRERLLRRAGRRLGARRRRRLLGRALVGMALALIVANLSFGQLHERRMESLMGPRPAAATALAAHQIAQRSQLLAELGGAPSADAGGS